MLKIDNLSSLELKELLKKVKLYKDLTKNLWNRWKKLFKNITENTHSYKVEYFPSMNEEEVKKEALWVIEKVFGEKILEKDLNLVKKESLKWWIRVFKDDNLVDLSYKKVSKIFE